MRNLEVFVFLTSIILATNACNRETVDKCDSIVGANFSSDAGRIGNLLQSKCGTPACHVAGGAGAVHWTFTEEYDSLAIHFEHMYEAVIVEGEMPPTTATALSQEEMDTFECWKQAGFPE